MWEPRPPAAVQHSPKTFWRVLGKVGGQDLVYRLPIVHGTSAHSFDPPPPNFLDPTMFWTLNLVWPKNLMGQKFIWAQFNELCRSPINLNWHLSVHQMSLGELDPGKISPKQRFPGPITARPYSLSISNITNPMAICMTRSYNYLWKTIWWLANFKIWLEMFDIWSQYYS